MANLSKSFEMPEGLDIAAKKHAQGLGHKAGCKLTRPLFLLLIICVFSSVAFGQPWDGNGVEGDPYLIYDACDMQAIGADANYWDAHFELMADINLAAYTGTSFNIIGIYIKYNDPNNRPFTGVFDGGGHTISNFTYNSNGVGNIGLFGYIDDPNAETKNLGLIEPNVDAGSEWDIGSLVGRLTEGIITNCYAEGGNVSGGMYVGGLVGRGGGRIIGCHATVSVSGSSSVGVLVGHSWGDIFNSYSANEVSSGGSYVGGLAGFIAGDVFECYSTATVIGDRRVGGLVGRSAEGRVIDSYALGTISGNSSVGGLVGVNVEGDWLLPSEIYNCYASGPVSATESTVGGLIGDNSGEVWDCYSTGEVTGDLYVGGLVGYDGSGSYTKCFWDSDVNPDVNGIGNGSDPNVISESTANMQTESTFTDAGWDFVGEVINGPNDIWDICEGTNYPKFVWQMPAGDFVCPDGVTFIDFSVLGLAWYSDPNQPNWNLICDVSEPNDNFIDELDLKVFTENWLAGM